MKLSQLKNQLKELEQIAFVLPNGDLVPRHFHVTEVGKVTKHFVDCGGTVRTEEVANLQLFSANDYDHRLHPEKLLHIIELSEKLLNLQNLEIEVEYQEETIGRYGLEVNGSNFVLTTKQTDCLAKDKCGIPAKKPRIKLSELQASPACNPNSGCC